MLTAALKRTLSRKRAYGKHRNRFPRCDKSQLAMAESPASDRIAFALSLLETGLRMRPTEKSLDSAPVLS